MSPRVKPVEVEETEVTPRDYLMARISAARASAQAVIDACDDVIGLCVDPEDDPKMVERGELIGAALDHIGGATRALECAEKIIPEVDSEECEPWDEDGDEVEDDEDDDEPELPRATARSRRR